METNKTKPEMPARKKEDISGGPRTTVRPEIDLPLKGGRADSDLAPKTPKKDERGNMDRPERSDRPLR